MSINFFNYIHSGDGILSPYCWSCKKYGDQFWNFIEKCVGVLISGGKSVTKRSDSIKMKKIRKD